MTEEQLLYLAKQKICEKMAWPHWDNWTHYHFETLSQKIFDTTKVKPSTSTLKRVFGKHEKTKLFNTSHITKNTLAHFLGFEDWEDFRQQHSDRSTNNNIFKKKPIKNHKYYFVVMLIVIVILFTLGYYSLRDQYNSLPSKISFNVEKKIHTYPKNIPIYYSISPFKKGRYFIEYNDFGRRSNYIIPNESGLFNCRFPYPGYFSIKLKQEKRIIAEESILILSDGWIRMVKQSDKPYTGDILKENIIEKERLFISKAEASKYNIDTLKYFESFYQIVDTFNVLADSFSIGLKMRNYTSDDPLYCDNNYLIIETDNYDFIRYRISSKECIKETFIQINETSYLGLEHDFSKLSIDLNQWIHMKIEFTKPNARFYLNDTIVFETTYSEKALGNIIKITAILSNEGEIADFSITDLKNQ